jgi:protein pelota
MKSFTQDSLFLQGLDDACDISTRAEVAALVMQEGLAHICLITPAMTVTKLKIERNLPKKRQVQE